MQFPESFMRNLIFIGFLSVFLYVGVAVPARAEEVVGIPSALSNDYIGVSTTNTVSATTTNAAATTLAIPTSTLDLSVGPSRELIDEPIIRVGLYKTDRPVQFQSEFTYTLFSGAESIDSIPNGHVVTLRYIGKVYEATWNEVVVTSSEPWRLVPESPESFFVLTNYTRTVSGRRNNNYNVYRGTMEYRYSPKSKLPYVINELPLDEYTAGIAESDDGPSMEYLKALLVAARSYAFAHISTKPPSDSRLFDVYATTVDQLYLGYQAESTMPRTAAAAAATAGEMVTYQGNPVITVYFSHSNGKTLTWNPKKLKSLGNRPWLTSVVAAYDKGKRQSGHGYGMSLADAMKRAKLDGWTYNQILGYYYSGTKVEKIY